MASDDNIAEPAGLLDFRLIGWRGMVPPWAFALHVLRCLWVALAVAAMTGMALFLFDPVHVGTQTYWAPKLVAVGLGLVNAMLFHRRGYVVALAAEEQMPLRARIARTPLLARWTAVVVFPCLDTRGAPNEG